MCADNIDLLIQHAKVLLSAIGLFAKLKELAGDAAFGEIAAGFLELLLKLRFLALG